MTAGAVRRAWALLVWRAAISIWCRSLVIEGRESIPNRPLLVVANHSSHADTVLLQFALATCHGVPVMVAGAEDYWFRNPFLAFTARALGVFAFPRRGELGPRRACRAIRRRASVLIFPQGSRSGDRFRAGFGRIAHAVGAEVLPVHISGTGELLPKGRFWPRSADILVRFGDTTKFGANETPEGFVGRIERIVMVDLDGAE